MRVFFHTLLIALLFTACVGGEKHIPSSSGAQGEVLVVMSKGHWESEPGALVRGILEQPLVNLPQREPRFKVVQCAPKDFGSLLQTHHTVLLASIGDSDTATTRPLVDRYARGQLVMQIAAPNATAWNRVFASDADALVAAFELHQLERVAKRLKKERDAELANKVEAYHGVKMDIPGGYKLMEQSHNTTWLERDRLMSGAGLEHNTIEGLLIHHHPYTSDTVFSVLNLVDLRDSVTRVAVEGPVPGSYMIVQRNFETLDLMPQGRAAQLDGNYAYLMHGLFGMEGAKMGGPFVSLSTVCESEGRLITVEGFVYAPQFNKREYIRELEAILFSTRLAPECIPLKAKE